MTSLLYGHRRWPSGVPVALLALPSALSASGGVANQLYGISARDPVVMMLVCAVLVASALIAAVLPARRAAHRIP